MTPQRYASPVAFKAALEQRLRNASGGGGTAFARARQRLVFERFLARVTLAFGAAVTLKGGLVLELRLDRARATNDVDLRMVGATAEVLERLQKSGRHDLGDFLAYEVAPDPQHPAITNPGMQYEGMRFRAECTLAGKPYGQPFGVDVAFGDPMLGEAEILTAGDTLAFAGLAPPAIRVVPVVTHIAEKVHAYTLPRERANSRVKDLPDLALLGLTGALDARALRAALQQTFDFRGTHTLPSALPAPSIGWLANYASLAQAERLRWTSLQDVTAAAKAFLDPVLGSAGVTKWEPQAWTWTAFSEADHA